ncbi:unnamed protein product [Cylindrotheca closterium]|uniref:Uncharacterized protein n=1 Tax=Cylindrotheca closterium TaxID=2856 RepID=A0AAD2CTW3_9STRA|nr:unnamed protein product [Cylindrotheca closterium]
MFPSASISNQEEDRHMTGSTTGSWLGAGIYVPPKDFPEMVDASTRTRSKSSRSRGSRHSKGSKASKGSKRNNSITPGDDNFDEGFGGIQFVGGPETNALALTTPPRGGDIKKPQSPSPTSIVEEQLRSLHDSFAKTLFGCQEDSTAVGNVEDNTKKNSTRIYPRNKSNEIPRQELTSNFSMFHSFGNACAPEMMTKMISGSSVVGEEKKDDEPIPLKKKRTKKRSTKEKAISIPETSEVLHPMDELIVSDSNPHEVSRGVSELTMRSSYARVHAPVPAQRRMAYYAVGKHNKQNARGGNRRCYFSGKLIVGDNPFYAGCVKQGMRTLVVFCLPSALGLPKQEIKPERKHSFVKSMMSRSSSRFSSTTSTTTSESAVSDGDDDDFDVNSRLDKDYLLAVLPEPSDELLVLMHQKYPGDYRTLPDQVRAPDSWRLYIQFCFFSGLPIAEGECYYKIKSEISQDDYGESIVLCHDIMLAVNGASSDMVRLPNLKTFQYLKKHYPQQSEKLPASVFERSSWEVVLPEI